MKKTNASLKVGDSVLVKPGVQDPDLHFDIGGWQGRITDIHSGKRGITILTIEWDSITLKNMPGWAIEKSEEQGLDWAVMNLASHQVEPATPRDKKTDVDKIKRKLANQYAWSALGEQGKRFRKVLAGIDADDEIGAMQAWGDYMEEHLTFPFEAEVHEFQERSPLRAGDRVKVTRITDVDDWYGVIAHLQVGRKQYDFPLCEMKVIDVHSPNYQMVDDYAVWFANR
jgi:hypothetical protein